MIGLLSIVDKELLDREVNSISEARLLVGTPIDKTSEELSSFLMAFYGYDLLSNASIRHLILTTLSLETLHSIAKTLRLPLRDHVYDAALVISAERWSNKGSIVNLLQDALYKHHNYRIPTEYSPRRGPSNPPSHEEVIAESLSPLFPFQQKLSLQISELFSKPSSAAMLQMPTGAGKTRTAMNSIINWIQDHLSDSGYIIWLSHTEELSEQAVDTLKRSWLEYGTGLVNIYRWYSSYEPEFPIGGAGIIFASLQKLYSRKKREDGKYSRISRDCKILVFDEAHKAIAQTYLSIINDIRKKSQDCVLLGLSATPGRSTVEEDGNRRLSKLFDSTLISHKSNIGDTILEMRQMGILAEVERFTISGLDNFELSRTEMSYAQKFFDLPPSALWAIGEDMVRNRSITTEVIKLVEAGNQCLLFSCSVEHAKLIAVMLCLNGVEAVAITSVMKRSTRQYAIRDFRSGKINVLVNFGILTTGFDAPNIGAVFILRPTASIILYSQMIGRGLRGPRVGGKKTCILIDVIDNIRGFGDINRVYDHFEGYWK